MWWLALIGWAGLSWAQDPDAASVVEASDVESSEEVLPSISSLRPRPLLGPDGLVWLGPFAPETSVRGLIGVSNQLGDVVEDVLVVDADNGLLWLEVGGAGGGRSVWTGRSWYRGEAPTDGTGVRVALDDEGVPQEIRWPDGSRVNVTFHEDMRVKSIEGPGNQVRRFEWDDILQTLRMTDGLGRVLSVRQLEGTQANQVIVQVEDTIGRSATSWWNFSADGVAHVTKWKDPKGGQTKVRTRAGVTTITGPTGRNWRLTVNGDTGRLAELVLPGGGAWSWGHDAEGNLTSMTDPMGRATRWTRGPEGRVLGADYLSRNIAYERDAVGNVVEIEELDGALVGLTRDSSESVVSIEDPAGNAVRFARDADGKPISIVSRTGGRWALGYDLLGRPNRLVNPTDRITTFQRNAQGHLTRILDSYFGDREFERTSSGLVTRVTDTAGRVFQLVRDSLGRVHRVARPDGSVLAVTRDPLGDVIGVGIDGVKAQVKRDAVGRLLGVDVAGRSIRWSLFLSGQIQTISEGQSRYTFRRDFSGLLRSVSSGDWRVSVERDEAGRPLRWHGSDASVRVSRDRTGAVVTEWSGEDELAIARNIRGMVRKIESEQGVWQWQYGAGGRVMRVAGPGEMTLGVDRDVAGRPTLIRYPAGTILRREYAGPVIHEKVWAASGAILASQSVELDRQGRVLWLEKSGEARQVWRYDPLGRLVVIEADAEALWAWNMDLVNGPHGELWVLDGQGDVAEARVFADPPIWGVGATILTAYRDRRGRLIEVGGDTSGVQLAYDRLGRIRQVNVGGEGTWWFAYDALGRLETVFAPEMDPMKLFWGPGSRFGWRRVSVGGPWVSTASDNSQLLCTTRKGELDTEFSAWLGGPTGLVANHDSSGVTEVVAFRDQHPALVVEHPVSGEQRVTRIKASPRGGAEGGSAGVAGAGGGFQPFPGGPIMVGSTSYDPLATTRIDGGLVWPWDDGSMADATGHPSWDPEPWSPSSPWSDPVELLFALGEFLPIDDGPWVFADSIEAGPANERLAWSWLPDSLDGLTPPLGPDAQSYPFVEDPVTMAFLSALRTGGRSPGPELVEQTILGLEMEHDSLDFPITIVGLESVGQ